MGGAMADRNGGTALVQERFPGLEVATLASPSGRQLFITAHATDDDPCAMFRRVAGRLRDSGARIVAQSVFAPRALHAQGLRALAEACGPAAWPVTWITGDGGDARLPAGTQVCAATGGSSTPIHDDGRVVGVLTEDDDARVCLLGDLRPVDPRASREAQAESTWARIEALLGAVRMDLSHLVRTWFYVDRILEWYADFNRVRTALFEARGIFQGLVPASTGVGAGNPQGAALVAAALAVAPRHPGVRISAVPSPLQGPAPAYGSAFSRAVEVDLPGQRRLYVSGTASIEPAGATAHAGDTRRQIERSLEVMEAILDSRGMRWHDVVRAVAYFKHPEDAPAWRECCAARGIPPLPTAIVHSAICRDDLLFEIEADAIRAI